MKDVIDLLLDTDSRLLFLNGDNGEKTTYEKEAVYNVDGLNGENVIVPQMDNAVIEKSLFILLSPAGRARQKGFREQGLRERGGNYIYELFC